LKKHGLSIEERAWNPRGSSGGKTLVAIEEK